MKFVINLIFYVLGVLLPILIIVFAITRPSKNKMKNIVNKSLLAVIIFLIFYILKYHILIN